MSWQDNRRRKRTWYKHYRSLCDQLVAITAASARTGSPVAAEAILKMFFDLYESRRLHKRRRVANSAFESLELACADAGLNLVGLTPRVYTPQLLGAGGMAGTRPPSIGEFGAETRTSTAPGVPPETGVAWPQRATQKEVEEIPF